MTSRNQDQPPYDPLDRTTFDAIAYNAVGRASEISTYPALSLTHSNGNSGWSVGIVQWDFGQPGRGGKVHELMSGYQAWASPERRFSPDEVADITRRLQTRGQSGNALSVEEQSRLNGYLRSEPGRELVGALNREQIDKKWQNVGEPLSRIPWLQELRRTDPAEAAEIVAQSMKLYNQNERRGERLIDHLENNALSAEATRDWIGGEGIRGLSKGAGHAIVTGRDNAIAGGELMNALELGEGRLAQAWRREIHERGNPSLYERFNNSPDVQLLDAMMRSPTTGRTIFDHVENNEPARDVRIRAARPNAAQEMSSISLSRTAGLTVTSPAADIFVMTREGWNRNGIPMQGREGRAVDMPDHTEGLRFPPQLSEGMRRPDTVQTQDPPNTLLDRLHHAVVNKDEKAMDASLIEYGHSPAGQKFQREIAAAASLGHLETRYEEVQHQPGERKSAEQRPTITGPVLSM